jgi:hypothetical protein
VLDLRAGDPVSSGRPFASLIRRRSGAAEPSQHEFGEDGFSVDLFHTLPLQQGKDRGVEKARLLESFCFLKLYQCLLRALPKPAVNARKVIAKKGQVELRGSHR